MTDDMTKADYAKSMLKSAYDVGSCGLGVQRQLVTQMVNDPSQIMARSYLGRALLAGADTNLIGHATNFGKRVFSMGHAINVEHGVREMRYNAKDLENFVLRTLAKGIAYAGAGDLKFSLHEAVDLFGALATKGYFSRLPSRHAVEKYLQHGMDMQFGATLSTEGVTFDYQRLSGDMENVMLGDARKKCVKFHSGKLSVMAHITDLAQAALVEEIGAQGRDDWFAGMKQDARLAEKWKELFDEDLPTPDALISSSKNVVENAGVWLGVSRGS